MNCAPLDDAVSGKKLAFIVKSVLSASLRGARSCLPATVSEPAASLGLAVSCRQQTGAQLPSALAPRPSGGSKQ